MSKDDEHMAAARRLAARRAGAKPGTPSAATVAHNAQAREAVEAFLAKSTAPGSKPAASAPLGVLESLAADLAGELGTAPLQASEKPLVEAPGALPDAKPQPDVPASPPDATGTAGNAGLLGGLLAQLRWDS